MKRNLLIGFLSLALLLIFTGSSFAQFGSISGRVIDDSTSLPIMGAHVWAKADTTQPGGYGYDFTDSSGYYMIDSLYAGEFLVFANAQGYEEETYPESVIVTAGQNTPDIDFALTSTGVPEYGAISGRVTDNDTGFPIVGARVVATGVDNYCYGEAYSDSDGYYILQDLCVGIWQVHASKPGYYPQIYPDTVTVLDGQTTPDIDFALTPFSSPGFGSISGRVTDETTGYPIPFAAITLSGIYGVWYTDSTGQYICDSIPVGGYWVTAYAAGYIQETYPESVIVFEGQNTSDIDFALTPSGSPEYGSISGWITDETTGLPITMAHIEAIGLDNRCVGEAWSDSDGYYIIQDLCVGIWLVQASKTGYYTQTYPDSVSVFEGQTTTDINFALTPSGSPEYGSISGRVTDQATGLPLIYAHLVATGLDTYCFGEAWSDSNGYYFIDDLCAGIWQVQASKTGYNPQVYPDTVTVVEGQTTPDIDFALTPAGSPDYGSISGMVTDEVTGIPLPMAHVLAYDSSFVAGEAWTDTAGLYLMQDIAAGQYIVEVYKDGYENGVYPESVTVEEGQNTPDINFALTPVGGPECGAISGRVTDEQTGLPIIMAEITITGIYCIWYTDTAGYYQCCDLPSGSYEVNARKEGYNPQTYPDSVIIVAGDTTYGIDFSLTPNRIGDVNLDYEVNVSDVIYIVNYLFKNGPAPDPMEIGDINCNGEITVVDVVYLINYLWKNGPQPGCFPAGSLIDYTGCKVLPFGIYTDSITPDQDCIQYEYDGESVLLIKHVNAGFNCCPDKIITTITIQDNIITIQEDETLENGGCDCLCLFDVDLRIIHLEPGEYTIKVTELYLDPEDIPLEFTVDLISSPSDTYCVQRNDYPWGIW